MWTSYEGALERTLMSCAKRKGECGISFRYSQAPLECGQCAFKILVAFGKKCLRVRYLLPKSSSHGKNRFDSLKEVVHKVDSHIDAAIMAATRGHDVDYVHHGPLDEHKDACAKVESHRLVSTVPCSVTAAPAGNLASQGSNASEKASAKCEPPSHLLESEPEFCRSSSVLQAFFTSLEASGYKH